MNVECYYHLMAVNFEKILSVAKKHEDTIALDADGVRAFSLPCIATRSNVIRPVKRNGHTINVIMYERALFLYGLKTYKGALCIYFYVRAKCTEHDEQLFKCDVEKHIRRHNYYVRRINLTS